MREMKLLPYEVKALATKMYDVPYVIKQLNAPKLWKRGEKGKGVVIAILDTGIDVNHPDLKGQIIGGRNFTFEGRSTDFNDRNGHGTHVAGVIAASENSEGIIGVAPEAQLLICKVLNKNGSGSYAGITAGIEYATRWRGENGERVRVINMSLGGSFSDRDMYKAILEACSAGIMVVVASGNEGDNNELTHEFGYPALYNECITVSACDDRAKLAPFSNNHKQVDVISAGVDVLSTFLRVSMLF